MTDAPLDITVNGAPKSLDAGANVRDLLAAMGVDPSAGGVAVAIGYAVIPKSRWADTLIQPDDAIEIVRATAGG